MPGAVSLLRGAAKLTGVAFVTARSQIARFRRRKCRMVIALIKSGDYVNGYCNDGAATGRG
jgi:hypothetical protein